MITTRALGNIPASWTRINSNTTTTITARQLRHIMILTKSSSGGTLTIYDSATASGTVLGVIDLTAPAQNYVFGIGLTSGSVTLVSAAGTAFDLGVATTT